MPEFGFARSLAWVRDGSALLRGAVVGLSAQAVHTPSPLPGWTRAHVLTHLARNADALANLLTWARTGVETPMYPDPAVRLDDIERGARRPATDVVKDVLSADDRLLNALDALPAAAWQATVRSALGRTIPASEVPWMRTRELWVHAVDLATDAPGDFDAFPPDLVDALLTDACATVGGKEGCPVLVLRPADRDRSWLLSGPEQLAEEVRGPAAALCAWLLGRDTASARKVSSSTSVSLPKWL